MMKVSFWHNEGQFLCPKRARILYSNQYKNRSKRYKFFMVIGFIGAGLISGQLFYFSKQAGKIFLSS